MKNAKKYLSTILSLVFAAPLFTACDNGLDDYNKTTFSLPSDKFDAEIQFVSRLTDARLASTDADFTAIGNYMTNTLKGKDGSWLTVLDRADGNNLPKTLQIALDTKRWSAFAMNRIVGKTTYEGSMLFFSEPSIQTKGIASGSGCYVTGISPTMKGVKVEKDADGNILSSANVSFPVHFNTARFENAEQIKAFAGNDGALGILRNDNINFLMIGTVKNDLFTQLQSSVQGAGGYAVNLVTQGSAYSVFMLADTRFWGFSGMTSESLGNGIEVYKIHVMW